MFNRIRLVSAMTALAAVALLTTAAAPAQASARPPAGLLALRTQVASRGNADTPVIGTQSGTPLYVEGGANISGVVGYAMCLYNSQDECISDSTSDGSPNNGPIDQTIDTVKDIVDVYGFIQLARGTWKYVLKWIYHYNSRLHIAPDAGSCGGDFGYDRDAIYASCNESDGIYWQAQYQKAGGFRWWNTYVKGDLIASSLQNGTLLYARSPVDWSTWITRPVCVNGC